MADGIHECMQLRSHHTNSYAHIIIKFNSERVTIFYKMVIYSRLGVKYYIDIISIPIHLDWVTNSSYKNIEIGNRSIKCSPYAGSNKAYAAFGSSRVLATPREGTRTLHLHVKIEKKRHV